MYNPNSCSFSYELFTQSTFTEDLDSANIALHEYLQSVQTSAKSHNEFALVTSNLTTLPSVNFPIAPNPQALFFDFLNIYDQLVDAWMAHLPSQVSVPSRLVKHKMIRQISIDLGLSSIGISFLRSNATSPADEDTGKPGELFHGRNERSTDNDSGFFSPEMTPLPSQRPSFSGRLITRTPSMYSQATDASSQTSEDPAIGRLRKYAVSIGSQPDPGRSKILSQWTVGADPSTYSWEAAKRAFMPPESGNEDSRKTRRENSRRRRLTEKFLSRQSSRATTAEPQPLAMRTDNQPAPHYDFSSQPESNMPMTQPDRGAFGSRTAQKSKKKRRNAGF
jgi:RNA polymerase I-specific transcription initiation factor RRN6